MDFTDLRVYQLGEDLVVKIYQLTKGFPKSELFGIISQLQRAVSSITANIAEGYGRFYTKDKIKFYYQSRGSLLEVKSFLRIAWKLNYMNEGDLNLLLKQVDDLGIRLNNYISSIKKNSKLFDR